MEVRHVISWWCNLSHSRLVYRIKKNGEIIPENSRQARLDSAYRSLFWENRKLYQRWAHGSSWIYLSTCSKCRWRELFPNTSPRGTPRVNHIISAPFLEKKTRWLWWASVSLVSLRIRDYEIFCRIFPVTRYSNWLFNWMMDDSRACLFSPYDNARGHYWIDAQEKNVNWQYKIYML